MSVSMTTRRLEPFGLEVTVPDGTPWSALPVEFVHGALAEHHVVVVRGVRAIEKAELPGAARRLGPLQAWSFGAVNELVPDDGAKNYLYTRRAVPLHWDGAFTPRAPRYLFFHCLAAPEADAGGETIFVDTTRVWARADEATRDRWRALSFAYETDRVVHYGGRAVARLVAQHPHTGETVLRFAEPVDDLNPVTVRAEELGPLESAAMITELRRALSDPIATLAVSWRAGDVVVADNHALLHGRRPFARASSRHLRRVNVHGPARTWRDALRDSLRIRRPEFVPAEIPILLVPAILAARSATELATWTFAEVVALFFLLFHFGDMINCLADRDLDAVYKTRLSEAVYGLGVRNVRAQIAITTTLALALGAHLAASTARWDVFGLVVFGLLLGAQYSVGPLRLKGRGLWQPLALWAVVFVGPMLLVARALSAAVAAPLVVLALAYGAMQEGIILVNTAEDLPEDRDAGVRTTAVALGLRRCLALATAMVAIGGAAVVASLARLAHAAWVVLPVLAAWAWVTWDVARAWRRAGSLAAVRESARRVPAWIATTAWGTLLSAALARA